MTFEFYFSKSLAQCRLYCIQFYHDVRRFQMQTNKQLDNVRMTQCQYKVVPYIASHMSRIYYSCVDYVLDSLYVRNLSKFITQMWRRARAAVSACRGARGEDPAKSDSVALKSHCDSGAKPRV